jgi:hypothetical protein
MIVSLDAIEKWLRDHYPIDPKWMADPDRPHDDFQGYQVEQVHEIIQEALVHWGQCPVDSCPLAQPGQPKATP